MRSDGGSARYSGAGLQQRDRLRLGRGPRGRARRRVALRQALGLGIANLRPIAGDGLFTAYNHEPNWQLAHDILARFSRAAMEGYHPLMLDVARQLTSHLGRPVSGPVDVPGDMTKLTLETIARTGFGHDFGSFERPTLHPFVNAMVGALYGGQRRANTVPPVLSCCLRGATKRNVADRESFNSTVDEVIEPRRAGGATRRPARHDAGPRTPRRQRSYREHPPPGAHVPRRRTRDHSGALRSRCTTSPATPPSWQGTQRSTRCGATGSRPAFDQVPKLRYIRRVLDEALRLWPTAPAFSREARENTVIAGVPDAPGDWAIVAPAAAPGPGGLG